MTIDYRGLDGHVMTPEDRDHARLPRAEGSDWVMIAPECCAVGCKNGRVAHSELCRDCNRKQVLMKPHWTPDPPLRWCR